MDQITSAVRTPASETAGDSAPPPRPSKDVSTQTVPLPSPAALRLHIPLSASARTCIARARERISARIAHGEGPPLVIVGPCSIHCETAALEYAERLARLQAQLGDRLLLVMRVYIEKPRTTVGWKGFLYDPDLSGQEDLHAGLVRSRALMAKISELGLPIATELLDPIAAEYLDDCLSWVAIGARTSESQIHRQLASRLPCPVGFKNGTDGSISIALQAMETAARPHAHFSIDAHGAVAMRKTSGNPSTHIVLRGGSQGPNYHQACVEQTAGTLRTAGLAARILVDCSHGNSNKDHCLQPTVAREVKRQLSSGGENLLGIMLESHLSAGRQSEREPRRYGVSVTDACIDFPTTEALLLELALG